MVQALNTATIYCCTRLQLVMSRFSCGAFDYFSGPFFRQGFPFVGSCHVSFAGSFFFLFSFFSSSLFFGAFYVQFIYFQTFFRCSLFLSSFTTYHPGLFSSGSACFSLGAIHVQLVFFLSALNVSRSLFFLLRSLLRRYVLPFSGQFKLGSFVFL